MRPRAGDGAYIGEIVYVARRRKARGSEIESSSTGYVTDYGWRPDGWRHPKNAKLTDHAGAVDRLRGVAEMSTGAVGPTRAAYAAPAPVDAP